MKADVVVVGSGLPAVLSAHLFTRRGFRTVAVARDRQVYPAALIIAQAEVASTVSFAAPPDDAVVMVSMSVEPWGPAESRTVKVRKLPYLLLDEERYCAKLARQAKATGKLDVVSNATATELVVERHQVAGVLLSTGQRVPARLVVDCGAAGEPSLDSPEMPWFFPDLSACWGRMSSDSRDAGAPASAWPMGRLMCQFLPGKGLTWGLRCTQNTLHVGALAIHGSDWSPQEHCERFFDDIGVPEDFGHPRGASRSHFIGLPNPVPIAAGYVALGFAAGQGNPVAPTDVSSVMTACFLAHAAGTRAMDDSDTTPASLWPYARSYAREWGASQAFAASLLTSLLSLPADTFDALFHPGLLDEYAVSSLFRNKIIGEGGFSGVTAAFKSAMRRKGKAAWQAALARARDAAALYRRAPEAWDVDAVWAWQKEVERQFPAPAARSEGT